MNLKKIYFQTENGGGIAGGREGVGMCSVWEGGLEEEERVGDRPPSLTLPTTILAVQPLGSGLALLDEVRPLFFIQL